MNAKHACFRSRLMQHFAAAARKQSRPPLALIGWLSEQDDGGEGGGGGGGSGILADTRPPSPSASLSGAARRSISSIATTTAPPPPLYADGSSSRFHESSSPAAARRGLSSFALERNLEGEEEEEDVTSTFDREVPLSALFQNLLQTRRTGNKFAHPNSQTATIEEQQEIAYWKGAVDRAVLCGVNAPNHKRTEPFVFKRMIGPSDRTERLADIAYRVNLKKRQKKGESEEAARLAATRKREKWRQVPAFLVALVSQEKRQDQQQQQRASMLDPTALAYVADSSSSSHDRDPYELLPYVPPETERDLEDYASACAAVQNILLSLHSEQIASKWVTGPVIRTAAFRELVQASPTDRVVALIMMGQQPAPDTKKGKIRQRRRHQRRRSLRGDVLVDL